jgi:hypothetical protein
LIAIWLNQAAALLGKEESASDFAPGSAANDADDPDSDSAPLDQ